MKNLRYLTLLPALAYAFAANAESVLSVSDVNCFEDSGDYYAAITIALNNPNEINTLAFDITLPAGASYVSTDCTQDRTQVKKLGKWNDTWSPSAMDHEGYLSFTANGKDGGTLSDGDGDIFVIYIALAGDESYSPSDFLFNNASAALGTTREEVKFPALKLGKNGYSTYSSSQDIVITGATAYYGVVDGSVLKLTEISGAVKNNEGVVLKGAEGDVVFGTSVDTAEAPEENSLTASVTGATVSNVHVLSTKDGKTGFYKYNGTTIGAGKAYLEGVTLSRVLFDEETGIDNVEMQNVEAIFNLQGQKLNETKKGINIVNGKKVMF